MVKEGFNWPAAIFTVFWALWSGLWLVALIIFLVSAGLQVALELTGADQTVQVVAGLGLSLLIGFCANDWRRAKLSRRGYRLQGIIAAENMDSARRRWFDAHEHGGFSGAGI